MANAHLNSTPMNSLTLGRIRSKSTRFNCCLRMGLLVAFVLIFSAPAEARRYQPPTGDPPKGSFGSNGSRGCGLTQDRSKPDALEGQMATGAIQSLQVILRPVKDCSDHAFSPTPSCGENQFFDAHVWLGL